MLSSVGCDDISPIPSFHSEECCLLRGCLHVKPVCRIKRWAVCEEASSQSSGCHPVATSQEMSKILKAWLNTTGFLCLKPSMTFLAVGKVSVQLL